MRQAVLLLIASGFVMACACNRGDETYREEDTGLVHVPDEDPEMDAAIAEAKRTIDEFIGYLRSPKPGMSMFAVKKPYPTRGGTEEHIWIEVEEFRDGKFHGTVFNEPVDIEGMALGSPASAKKSEISDWLIATDGEPLGGLPLLLLIIG